MVVLVVWLEVDEERGSPTTLVEITPEPGLFSVAVSITPVLSIFWVVSTTGTAASSIGFRMNKYQTAIATATTITNEEHDTMRIIGPELPLIYC